jgi:LytS/YehU family sensor histidine kinase
MCVLITATLYEGVTYFDKWKTALSEAEQMEKLNLESQFQSLQSQLNPHFLFNSLNVLSSLITENPRRAEDFVDEVSNVYRYLLRSNEQELASVGEELRFIRSFFHLLKTRHETGISLKISVSANNLNKKIPTLALQILVENAVKHNEVGPEKPLFIEIADISGEAVGEASADEHASQQSYPRLLVRNTLQRKTGRISSTRVGLDNLRQRYELLGVAGFEVQHEAGYFTVVLPLL